MNKIVLGYAPTRRNIFSAPDAVIYANKTREKLNRMGIEFVDIDDISKDGLFHSEEDRIKIQEKFKKEKIDGLFFPHVNFGTEYEVARLAKEMDVPVLLWGPRDEAPDENGVRLRDSQCGLFATGKVLRRFGVTFSYLTNCRLEDREFEEGLERFLAVCNVVKVFKNTRILQIGPRPFDFWSTMCNEGELLERFNIQISPIPLPELTRKVKEVQENPIEMNKTLNRIEETFVLEIEVEDIKKIAALTISIKQLADKYGCNAIAIQCWNELQNELGIMPCAANSILNEDGIPVVCETDIHGAISAVMCEAAGMGKNRSFFADWTVRHPENENGELLQHCGPWPASVASKKPVIGCPLAFDHPGSCHFEAKKGEMTLCRFDGDNGEYSMLLGNAKGIEGPYTQGTYVWIEVENLSRLEEKLVTGPYIHHCVGIHEDIVPVLYEACKYLGIQPDLYDENEDKIKCIIRGER